MKYDFEPIPGKPFAYRILDKETRQPVDVAALINEQFMKGTTKK